ncbi:succinate dehydrogenase, cytochrome b556 subunit [Mesorhizobium sp. CAU 1732]|uniref:succinate dehydrogenase, cytochrome b556 subunit n=1 Tax=Mesorhizobium sp. CAU 1732 TaxID=3140358 RepID=UPI00325FF643
MSKSAATRARPLSPHLQIYKPIPTMVMSIVHRITGVGLYFGILLVAAWLLAAATSEDWFNTVSAIYGSWIGRLILFAYTWALIHHMLGGIRHLVMDTGKALGKQSSTTVATAMPFVSIGLTLLLWVVGYFARGA